MATHTLQHSGVERLLNLVGAADGAVQKVAAAVRNALEGRRARLEDAQLLELAERDPSLMAELRAISCRDR